MKPKGQGKGNVVINVSRFDNHHKMDVSGVWVVTTPLADLCISLCISNHRADPFLSFTLVVSTYVASFGVGQLRKL